MSKFKKNRIKGDQNQFGDNNKQVNKNTTVYNNYGSSNTKPSDPSEAAAIFIGAAFLFALIVWGFFKNIETVYFYLELASLSSPLLGLFSLILLVIYNEVENQNLINVSVCICISFLLIGFIFLAENNVSPTLVELSNRESVLKFFGRLSKYGQFLVGSNFLTALIVGLCALWIHLFSIRQLSYSFADNDRKGFWYSLYRTLDKFDICKSPFLFGFLIILIMLCIAASSGYISFLFR